MNTLLSHLRFDICILTYWHVINAISFLSNILNLHLETVAFCLVSQPSSFSQLRAALLHIARYKSNLLITSSSSTSTNSFCPSICPSDTFHQFCYFKLGNAYAFIKNRLKEFIHRPNKPKNRKQFMTYCDPPWPARLKVTAPLWLKHRWLVTLPQNCFDQITFRAPWRRLLTDALCLSIYAYDVL